MVSNIDHNFETLRFYPLNFETVSLQEIINPDKSYFGDYLNERKTEYFCQDEIKHHLNTIDTHCFSILHHNIIVKRDVDNFKSFFL